MSKQSTMMSNERFSLTCAPGGENHAGMEIIGRMPIKGEGLTCPDMEGLYPYLQKLSSNEVSLMNLNEMSGVDIISGKVVEDQARVLILREWLQSNMGSDSTQNIYNEISTDEWDAEYLDPNKYRTEIVDGKEVKVRGKKMNKLARTNLCYVADREQEPSVFEGKGRIVDIKKKEVLNQAVEKLKKQIADGLISIGSKTKVEINVVEGNRYYNLKKTGIGFHGDTERVIVICITIGGGGGYPMRWQWFKDSMPVGDYIDIELNDGDVYIMSEKAVGSDWKLSSLYTLRHSAGAKKYRSLAKWEKRRPAYEEKLRLRAEKKELKAKKTNKKVTEKVKIVKKKVLKKKRFKLKQPILKNKIVEKETKAVKQEIKAVKQEIETEFDRYKEALKNHTWENSEFLFRKWIDIEANHDCSPENKSFKELQKIWKGRKEINNICFASQMHNDEKKVFYKKLCIYANLGLTLA